MAVARPLPGFAGLVESEPASAALGVGAVALAVYAFAAARPVGGFGAASLLASVDRSEATRRDGRAADRRARAPVRHRPLVRRLAAPVAGGATVTSPSCIAYRHALPQIWHGVVTATRAFSRRLRRSRTSIGPRRSSIRARRSAASSSRRDRVDRRRRSGRSDRRLLVALAVGRGRLRVHPQLPPVERPPLRVPRRHARRAVRHRARPARDTCAAAAARGRSRRLLVVAAFFAAGIVKDRREIVGANMAYPPGDPLGDRAGPRRRRRATSSSSPTCRSCRTSHTDACRAS